MDPLAEDRAIADDDVKRSIEALFKEADGRSVSELLARHNRERLFVRPLLWDYRQPALLQCRFLPCKRPAPPLPRAPPPDFNWYPLLPREEASLAEELHRRCKPATAFELLNGRYLVEDGCEDKDIKFFYKRQPLCHVGYVVCLGLGVCFLDKTKIQSMRDRLLNRPKKVSKARRRFSPSTFTPDPYIAAVCIALAQSQRSYEEEMAEYGSDQDSDDTDVVQALQPDQDTGGREKTPPTEEAQAISAVVTVYEEGHITVFAADVTPAFLAKLDDPWKPPPPGASMDIHQQRVKFRPYKTFAARFAGAVRDTRHRCGPGGQGVGQSSSAGQEGESSSLLCIRQPASSVDSGEAYEAKAHKANTKRKYSDCAN